MAASAEVPAGEYLLALHRFNRDVFDEDAADDYDGPFEVITLSPFEAASSAAAIEPLLFDPGTSEPGCMREARTLI